MEEELQNAIEHGFECLRCGHCCKGDGLVHFGPAEADRMAARLGLTRRRFIARYALRTGPGRWMLRDKWVETPSPVAPRPELWCIFLERDPDGRYGCAVNEAKPDQCRSFPAEWRNPDSLLTCAGLRALMAKLRKAKSSG